MIQIAIGSQAYQSFASNSSSVAAVTSSPDQDYAIQYQTTQGCSSVTIVGYAFNFVSNQNQIAILVSPLGSVIDSLITPISNSAGSNTSGSWFGYGFWDGGTISNPSTPYIYVGGSFNVPTIVVGVHVVIIGGLVVTDICSIIRLRAYRVAVDHIHSAGGFGDSGEKLVVGVHVSDVLR